MDRVRCAGSWTGTMLTIAECIQPVRLVCASHAANQDYLWPHMASHGLDRVLGAGRTMRVRCVCYGAEPASHLLNACLLCCIDLCLLPQPVNLTSWKKCPLDRVCNSMEYVRTTCSSGLPGAHLLWRLFVVELRRPALRRRLLHLRHLCTLVGCCTKCHLM